MDIVQAVKLHIDGYGTALGFDAGWQYADYDGQECALCGSAISGQGIHTCGLCCHTTCFLMTALAREIQKNKPNESSDFIRAAKDEITRNSAMVSEAREDISRYREKFSKSLERLDKIIKQAEDAKKGILEHIASWEY